MRRGLVIAQDSGNRYNESHLALNLAWLEAEHGDPASAFDHLTLSIRNYHDSGNTALTRAPLAILAALLNRLGTPRTSSHHHWRACTGRILVVLGTPLI